MTNLFSVIAAASLILSPIATSEITYSSNFYPTFPERIAYVEAASVEAAEPLSHAQETWLSALEWCESRGKPSAINPMDSDGTPSYYSFQFKPGTFRWLGEKYEVISKGQSDIALMSLMKKTELQRQIVSRMIKDKDIDMSDQFPDCVLNKIGFPPAY